VRTAKARQIAGRAESTTSVKLSRRDVTSSFERSPVCQFLNRIAITIGDVMGEGLGATLAMGKLKQATLDAAEYRIFDPRDGSVCFASAGTRCRW
jgi:hypothetical protein